MILMATQGRKLRNGQVNAKTPPNEFWSALVALLGDGNVVQIGEAGEVAFASDMRVGVRLQEIKRLVSQCETWVSPDSFLPHLANHVGKSGVVVWSVSDPNIFGYARNTNILKSRQLLRKNQFGLWESEPYNANAFVDPKVVYDAIMNRGM